MPVKAPLVKVSHSRVIKVVTYISEHRINGLESKMDNCNEFLSSSTSKLDIIAITETSEKDEIGFLSNVEMEGYDFYHTASKSSKGGSAIYVNKNYNSIQRNDLEISNVEFESMWNRNKK